MPAIDISFMLHAIKNARSQTDKAQARKFYRQASWAFNVAFCNMETEQAERSFLDKYAPIIDALALNTGERFACPAM